MRIILITVMFLMLTSCATFKPAGNTTNRGTVEFTIFEW